MPYYEWRGSGQFNDNRNNRVLEHGDVAELPEHHAQRFEFVKVDAQEDDSESDNPQGSTGEDDEIYCSEGDCGRKVSEPGEKCWQHEKNDEDE